MQPLVHQSILNIAYASKMAHHVEEATTGASCIPNGSRHSYDAIFNLMVISHNDKISNITLLVKIETLTAGKGR